VLEIILKFFICEYFPEESSSFVNGDKAMKSAMRKWRLELIWRLYHEV
jgi:hypothetical protein